jgi:hypothetical protein
VLAVDHLKGIIKVYCFIDISKFDGIPDAQVSIINALPLELAYNAGHTYQPRIDGSPA